MLFLMYQSDHDTALLRTPPQIPLSPVPTKALHHPPLPFRVLLSTLPPCSLSYSNHTGFLSISHKRFYYFSN